MVLQSFSEAHWLPLYLYVQHYQTRIICFGTFATVAVVGYMVVRAVLLRKVLPMMGRIGYMSDWPQALASCSRLASALFRSNKSFSNPVPLSTPSQR